MMWFHDLFPNPYHLFSFVCFVPLRRLTQNSIVDNRFNLCTLSIPHALSLSLTCLSSLSGSPNIAWSLAVSNRRESVGIEERQSLSRPSPASPLFDLLLQSGKRGERSALDGDLFRVFSARVLATCQVAYNSFPGYFVNFIEFILEKVSTLSV